MNAQEINLYSFEQRYLVYTKKKSNVSSQKRKSIPIMDPFLGTYNTFYLP